MGGVVRFKRPIASSAIITSLVKLGYLQPGARHRATAIQRAVERLRTDLMRYGAISGGDLSGWQDHPVAKDDLAMG
jgi:hypothetical protein